MKVGTDAVLLGSWAHIRRGGAMAPPVFQGAMAPPALLLDIGTGTGVIALMLAQRFPDAHITALEIDEEAAKQARGNVEGSAWADRIEVVQADFRIWSPDDSSMFDLIICNPPYFTRSLKNPDFLRAKARHDDDLPLGVLLPKASGLLTPEGKISLILPVERTEEALELAAKCGLFILRRTDIRGNPGTAIRRVLLEWGREEGPWEADQLIVETEVRGVYTEEYRRLTGEFYL